MTRFTLPPDAPLRPFAIAGGAGRARLAGTGVRLADPTDPADTAFCLAMNRANCIAYDGTPAPGSAASALGMPLWVLLDCCALPSAVFGFETPREFVPDPLLTVLDPGGELPWVGVTEYVALPSLSPGEVVGVSLFSLAAGARWGQRTKAMALRLLGANRQVGVTQYASPGVKLHLAFGPLRVIAPQAAVHSRPTETFVYAVDVPEPPNLAALERGEVLPRDGATNSAVRLDPRAAGVNARVADLARSGPIAVVAAGPVVDGEVTWLDLAPA
ncbi:MAG: hypothetical protein H6698_07235 [Myxococcales bacterium]|nr:hypothetical protein [Myxococcales bacterium]MCB9531734.1 hypothetical protein [Myxococcales bacterium]MCB9534099.1 hypothetical protein [Myxococcales bacterium]